MIILLKHSGKLSYENLEKLCNFTGHKKKSIRNMLQNFCLYDSFQFFHPVFYMYDCIFTACEHLLKKLNDCNQLHIYFPRNRESHSSQNSDITITWDVIVSEPQCSSVLSFHITQLSIYTKNDSCTDYLKVRSYM